MAKTLGCQNNGLRKISIGGKNVVKFGGEGYTESRVSHGWGKRMKLRDSNCDGKKAVPNGLVRMRRGGGFQHPFSD